MNSEKSSGIKYPFLNLSNLSKTVSIWKYEFSAIFSLIFSAITSSVFILSKYSVRLLRMEVMINKNITKILIINKISIQYTHFPILSLSTLKNILHSYSINLINLNSISYWLLKFSQQLPLEQKFFLPNQFCCCGCCAVAINNFVYKYFLMDIGSAIAVFLVLSLVMLALFCFITKYFHYKLKRRIEENNQVYSMVDEIQQGSQNEQQYGEQYDEFKQNKIAAKPKLQGKKKIKDDQIYIEMTNLKTPLKHQDDLYQAGQLRQKLNGLTGSGIRAISKQQSSRQISQLKSFRPQKLITTNRTDRTKEDNTKHTFIHKLVCYNHEGITVCDVLVKMIRKVSAGVIKESKTCKTLKYSNFQDGFDDQLEIMGFERDQFGCYKYETSVQVTNMKTDENYMVKSLKTSESKQQISQLQYLKYFNQITQGRINQ